MAKNKSTDGKLPPETFEVIEDIKIDVNMFLEL